MLDMLLFVAELFGVGFVSGFLIALGLPKSPEFREEKDC
jgi:hypothetical protein